MSSYNNSPDEEQIDPRVFQLLEQLRPIPPRDPEAEKRGRDRFLSEVESLSLPSRPRSPLALLVRRLQGLADHQAQDTDKENQMTNPKTRFALTAIMLLIVAIAFLFGGSAITAMASQSALPGDALYPVKMTIEQTQLTLARSAAVRAQLQLEFAERRLAEIEALVAEGRYQQVSTATVEYEAFIRNALADIDLISQVDPSQATQLMLQISQSLARYARTLTVMMGNVPEPVRAELMRSIEAVQGVSGEDNLLGETEFAGTVDAMDGETWTIAGRTVMVTAGARISEGIQVRDQVRVHAYQDVDGQLRAREIERVRAGIDNANQNENGNGNINSNENQNGNGNANQNSNLNANENDNANTNLNQNQNQNRNENDNDNANTNMNLNRNDNEDVGNENQNQNQNHNSNDNENGNENLNQNQNHNDNDNDSGGNQNQNQNSNDNENGNGNLNQNQNRNDNDNDSGGNQNDNNNDNDNGSDD
jgi:hypothetical protein